MKKYILFILGIFIANAQNSVITFEDDSFIASADLIVGGEADEVSIVVDPTDASNKVLKFSCWRWTIYKLVGCLE